MLIHWPWQIQNSQINHNEFQWEFVGQIQIPFSHKISREFQNHKIQKKKLSKGMSLSASQRRSRPF